MVSKFTKQSITITQVLEAVEKEIRTYDRRGSYC
jgi:hypothetical protein